jgi:hypothetical protein
MITVKMETNKLSQYEFQKDTQGNFKAKCRHCPTYTHLVVRKSLPISRLPFTGLCITATFQDLR